VPRVAELGEDDEDLVGLLAAQLDVLIDAGLLGLGVATLTALALLADLDDRAGSTLLRRRLAAQDLRDRDLTGFAPLVLQRVRQLVGG
jgi:hypothetical protein